MKRVLCSALAVAMAWLAAAAERRISVDEYRDRMRAGWLGQIAGVAWGWPTEFKFCHKIIPDDQLGPWKPEYLNGAFDQDDLYVEMTFLELLEKHGLGVPQRRCGIAFANSRYRLWHANARGRDALRRGIAPPDSGHPQFNACANDIDYQIESDFSGLVAPGCFNQVVALGEKFGGIMNYGDGLYAGQFVGAMYAAAFFESDRVKVVERALACIPSGCRYAEMVRDCLAWHAEDPKDWEKGWAKVEAKYGRLGGCTDMPDVIEAILNGAQVLLGFLWGDGDPERTIRIACRGGYDSDCNPSTAGGVLFTMLGERRLPEKFKRGIDETKTFEFTDYTFPRLLAASEKVAREVVVAEGGRIERDASGAEWFVIPERPVKPSKLVSFAKPGPIAGSRFTAEEMREIRFLPCKEWGGQSEPKPQPVNPDAIDLVPIPRPAEMTLDSDRPVAFDKVKLQVDTPGSAAEKECAAWLESHFREWFGEFAPRVEPVQDLQAYWEGDEAYFISADAAHGVRIVANTLTGVRWAAYTLRQLATAKRGTFKTAGYQVPTMRIVDKPLLKFRGIHLCLIDPMRVTQIERAIRLAALMKFNYVVLEPWGTYKSEKHPWRNWPNAALDKATVRRLVAVGRDLGVTLIPQINLFGHASAARGVSLKHCVLDFHPEYEPLFEPGGWNWCLSNPETQRVLRELVAEMHEDFGNPPFFHIGCDEAQPPTCAECRKVPYGELVCKHITGIAQFIKSRGAQAMMWHDMLIDKDDPRWNGFVAMGSKATATLADTLPRDVIVCDWQYSYGDMNETRADWPTIGYFKEKGFRVCGAPWRNFNAMKPMADYIARVGGFGILETTWNHLRGRDWRDMYVYGAGAAWGTSPVGAPPLYDTHFARALRFVGHDMHISDKRDTGIYDEEIPELWWPMW